MNTNVEKKEAYASKLINSQRQQTPSISIPKGAVLDGIDQIATVQTLD